MHHLAAVLPQPPPPPSSPAPAVAVKPKPTGAWPPAGQVVATGPPSCRDWGRPGNQTCLRRSGRPAWTDRATPAAHSAGQAPPRPRPERARLELRGLWHWFLAQCPIAHPGELGLQDRGPTKPTSRGARRTRLARSIAAWITWLEHRPGIWPNAPSPSITASFVCVTCHDRKVYRAISPKTRASAWKPTCTSAWTRQTPACGFENA